MIVIVKYRPKYFNNSPSVATAPSRRLPNNDVSSHSQATSIYFMIRLTNAALNWSKEPRTIPVSGNMTVPDVVGVSDNVFAIFAAYD